MSKEKVFIVDTSFIFKGKFFVKAQSQEEANKKVKEDCGLVMGGNIHTNLDDGDINWDFNTHPEKIIGG